MKFTKLRIAGFKTFIEPTDLLIDDGLTGVVGPNGCGKSNLVEAMRWAMGESSYKAMRASGMEEVIFSGSAKRPARNWAEVKLFLDNDDRRAPAAFNEHETIEVSRKIERDKGSAYRVNGREARARDIQLMFADAASGARSPSMVRQGQIGEIISAKPVQRRALLEEAAGISGLHTRRHEAELRLKAAEANIERLDDVIAELDRQLDGLRKQARQAARYREIAAKTRTVEAGVYALKWAAANQAANDATRDLAEAKDALARADEAQLSSATAQASAAALVPAAREKAAEAGAALGRLLRARDELASEERRISDRLDSARAQLETLNADIARETGLSEDHTAEKQALDADLAAIRTEVEAVAARQPSLESALEAAQSALTAALAETQTAREALASGRAQREAQAKLRLAAQRDLEETNAKLAAARQALDALKEQLVGADALDAARQKAQETNDAASKAAEAVVAAEGRRTGSMQALAEAEQPLRDAEKALNFTRAEVAALEKLVGPQNSGEGGHTAILDLLEVASGFETALGAALGEALEAATDEAAPAFWRDNPGPGADPALPDGCEPLAAHVSGSPMLARALAQVGLVTDPAQGDVLQTALAAGQLLVSRDGAVWRWDGLVRRAEAPSAAAVKLAERNRLADLRADADAQAATVEALRSAHTEALAALAQADATLNASRSEERAARQQQQEAASALIGVERNAERESARLAAAQADVERLVEAAAAAEQAASAAQAQSTSDGDLEAMENALRSRSSQEEEARARRDEAAAHRDTATRELADLRRREASAVSGLDAWAKRAQAAADHAETLARRKADLEATLAKLDGAPGELVEKRRALAAQIQTAEAERSRTADELARRETAQREADTSARTAKEAYFAAREAHGRAEERSTAADERRRALEAIIIEAVDAAPHQLMAMAGFEPGMQPPQLDQLERELAKLKDARARLGAVNLAAESEAEDVASRRDVMALERDDVAEAINKLRGTISTLNREGRAKLLEAFDRVNAQFQELFTRLFGGGDAELQLVDADDPLDAGLEIFAKPPGKKPQSITLLSGGEQALTAMALIFAVFLSNPAPVCVLDEVDAPLDDANVERFCDLLHDMSQRTSTRFLVVTHNPITMSRMHRLFGVTMAERGVSQIVTVALEEAEALVASETAA